MQHASPAIDGYDDIHDNLRYWMGALARAAWGRELVVYDIGANDGELSLPLFEVGGFSGARSRGDGPVARGSTTDGDAAHLSVIAFEPAPAARSRLVRRAEERGLSVALWGKGDVTIIPVALGEADETTSLEIYTDDTFSSLFGRPEEDLERYRLELVERVEVRVRPLDDLVEAGTVPPPSLIKIDVEGAERSVLTGAARTLATYRPPVIVEYSCVNTQNAGYRREEIAERLRSAGYDGVYGLFRNEDRHLYDGAILEDCRIWNLIAVAHGRAPGIDRTVADHRRAWKE